jgi:hypothetical protein
MILIAAIHHLRHLCLAIKKTRCKSLQRFLQLFHRYAFSQVAGHIYIVAFCNTYIIAKQL